MTELAGPVAKFTQCLNPKNIWRNYLLYNKAGISALSVINRLRWSHMDITVMVWPPARKFFDRIEHDIRSNYQIIERSDYLIDDKRFDEFVRKVYDVDSASPRKISYKLENLVRPPLEIRVMTVRFSNPDMEVQDMLNRVRCKNVHVLKEVIRADYRGLVTNYVFDIIIHSTETALQGDEVKKLLENYGSIIGAEKS